MESNLITAWRIVRARYAAAAFTGEGSRRASGRWNHRGTAMVYTAESRSLAVLEMLVHLDEDEFLKRYRLIPVTFQQSLVREMPVKDLPTNWNRYPAPDSTKEIGDAWVSLMESAVLKAPSVIVSGENNYLLNPQHADFHKIQIGTPQPFRFDRRLRRDT